MLPVVVWHIFLVQKYDKPSYFGYAVINITLYAILGFFCQMVVTGEYL